MSFKGAVDRIGTWTVTGVTTNYGLDDLPGVLPENALPALVLAAPRGGANKPFDLGLTKAVLTVFIDHVLVLRGAGAGKPQSSYYGGAAIIDNYVAKVLTDWTLNENLLEPLQIVSASFEPVIFGSVAYYGCVLRHKWVLTI